MRIAPLACLFLVACAGAGGNWPSLARRPAEKIAAGLPVTAAAAAAAPATPAPSSATAVTSARLADADKDLTAIEGRWTRQQAATDAAVKAARGTAKDSDAWSAAELERSRFDKVGAQASDARERLNAIAGDLAVAASNGGDASAALAATGKLIARADALIARHAAAEALK